MSSFVGMSDEQEAAANASLAASERDLERRIKQNEAQKNRDLSLRQQEMEIGGKRALASDEYGYQAALAGQRGNIEANRDASGYMHEDELFERHAAATMSQMRLEQIKQERMAAMQRDAQRERDYLQQGFEQQNVAQTQKFQAGQEERRFEQEKELGGIQHQYSMESQGNTQDFQLYRDQQLAHQHVMEEAFHVPVAAQLKQVETAIEYGYKAKLFNEENMAKAKQILDARRQKTIEENKVGIANGTHEYLSDTDTVDMLTHLPNAISTIENSLYASDEEKDAAKAQVYHRMDEITARARPISEAKRAQSLGAKRMQVTQGWSTEDQKNYGGFLIPDSKGSFATSLGKILQLKQKDQEAKIKEKEAPALSEKKLEFDQRQQNHFFDIQSKVNENRSKEIDKREKVWRENPDNEGQEPSDKEWTAWEAVAKRLHPNPPELNEYRKQTGGGQQQQPRGGQGQGGVQPQQGSQPLQESNWKPNAKDLRQDGSQKGSGFLGTLKRPDGGVSGEISIGVNLNGKETEIPSMVPTLSKEEINYLLTNPLDENLWKSPTGKSIMQKAVDHAKMRIKAGKSVWAGQGEGPPHLKGPEQMKGLKSGSYFYDDKGRLCRVP